VLGTEGSILVEADKTKIFEVLSNLLRNAVKFTDAGKITLSLRKQDGFALVRVRDNGKGIDPEIMPRLFEKFAAKSESGTGIGLFISKSIIEAHGGKIWAENNRDERGATFSFSLPLLKQSSDSAETNGSLLGYLAAENSSSNP
jgi:signal transduction histidine kinase